MRPEFQSLTQVFDVIDIGLIVLDAEARIIAWNQWMEAASGVPAAQAALSRSSTNSCKRVEHS